jgi:hypothetical protein
MWSHCIVAIYVSKLLSLAQSLDQPANLCIELIGQGLMGGRGTSPRKQSTVYSCYLCKFITLFPSKTGTPKLIPVGPFDRGVCV